MLIEDMAQFLRENNAQGRFIVLSWQALKIENVNPEKIMCPPGFYYDSKHKIIRRADTLLESFEVKQSEDVL